MSKLMPSQNTNVVHPEKPSALGSRNSANRHNRDEYSESMAVIDEEVDKILNHINGKLPPEVLSKLHVNGNVKELLHNYYNQGYQNMFNRYITTVEDELAKKFKNLVDNEESSSLNSYAARSISKLLDQVGGENRFNTGEIEKSVVNIYGHLQGHVQRGVYELEQETNSVLRQKIDVGAFIRGENTYAVIKCAFRDSFEKPEFVNDIQIAINVLENELISKMFHYQEDGARMLKSLLSDRLLEAVDKEVEADNEVLYDEGRDELSDGEKIFEKLKKIGDKIDHYNEADVSFGDLSEVDRAAISSVNRLLERIKGSVQELEVTGLEELGILKNVNALLEEEHIRHRGFNTVVNMMTNILDSTKMGYQHIDNKKNARKVTISEYSQTVLRPDECFSIELSYLDGDQIGEMKLAYSQQIEELEGEINKLGMVADKVYEQSHKKQNGNIDFDDVIDEYFVANPEDDEEEDSNQLWDEHIFIVPEDSKVEQENPTYNEYTSLFYSKLNEIERKMSITFKEDYSDERLIVEQRLNFLRKAVYSFFKQYNPYQCNPGLLLAIDISTIKRKETTMKAMSNVLNEFLSGISRGFSDNAFANFSRRRSTDSTGDMLVGLQPYRQNLPEDSVEESEVEGMAEL